MSFFTKSETATIPFSTFTTTDKGIVQTGTVESVTVSIITGMNVPTTTDGSRTAAFRYDHKRHGLNGCMVSLSH